MTTDWFFMPTPLLKPPCAMRPDKVGSSTPEPSSQRDSLDIAKSTDRENFLTTLQNLSKDHNRSEVSHRQPTSATDQKGPADRSAVYPREDDAEPVDDDTLNDTIALLEKLGLTISTGLDSSSQGTQWAHEPVSNRTENILDSLAAFQRLLGGSQSHDLKTDDEMAHGLERLRQFIARIMGAGPNGQDPNGLKENFNPGKEIAAGVNGVQLGEGAGAEKQVESPSALIRAVSSADSADKASEAAKPVENTLAGESAPASKLLKNDQVLNENQLKTEPAAGDDVSSKVVKLEAGTNDSGQLASHSQTFEKMLENASLAKEADAASRELRPQTLEQIVRRAVIQVRDGQHEARIDLKPEFLGHVRMQVITANQQVTVKILTEFGFVKDMIENSIQQLKAELQQQGLEVDKVDVSVSRDFQGNKHPQENAEHAGNRQRAADSNNREKEHEREPELTRLSSMRADGHVTVDYFA